MANLQGNLETIFVIEDDKSIRDLVTSVLTSCNYNVITASNGKEAIEIYKLGLNIAVVVLDLTMPVMGGRECLKEILKINPSAKVIISSGEVEDSYELKGASGFLQKPYSVCQLLTLTKELINE